MGQEWYATLSPFLQSEEFTKLTDFINTEYNTKTIYPEKENIFKAFRLCPFNKTRIVWIGLDPYIKGEATGLSFGIDTEKNKIPPSLEIIIQELENYIDEKFIMMKFDYSLEHWAKQGILMLNTALTVERKKTGSHLEQWSKFTENVFNTLNSYHTGLVFVLLGKEAQKYKKYINQNQYVIEAPHPASELYSGRTSGFLGSNIFGQIDEIIYKLNNEKIKWI